MFLVSTSVGDVPERDLSVKLIDKDEEEAWIVARECTYIGTEHPQVINQIVRRDVWVTMKHGQAASAEAAT